MKKLKSILIAGAVLISTLLIPETALADDTPLSNITIVHSHSGTNASTSANGCYTTSYSNYEVTGSHTEEKKEYATKSECYACGNEIHYCTCSGGCKSSHTVLVAVGTYNKTVYDYGYVTRYKCTHDSETIGTAYIYMTDEGLKATVTPASGLNLGTYKYSWKIAGTTAGTEQTQTITGSGIYACTITYTDPYGAGSKTVTISTTITYTITGTLSTTDWTNKDVTLTMSSVGEETKEYSLDNETWQTSPLLTITSNGDYTVYGKSVNGTQSTYNITVSNIDKVAPSIVDITKTIKPTPENKVTITAED